MKLVEHDRADALQRRIVEDHAGEHAPGHDLDPRASGDEALEPDAKADRLADALAQGRRHARRRGARREPARLEQEEALAPGPGLVEKRERGARRLAGAGRGDEHRARVRAERGLEGAKRVVDRQGLGEAHHPRPVMSSPRKRGPRNRSDAADSGRQPGPPLSRGRLAAEPRRPYVPTETAVCSVERSSLTPGPMVEETAARKR